VTEANGGNYSNFFIEFKALRKSFWLNTFLLIPFVVLAVWVSGVLKSYFGDFLNSFIKTNMPVFLMLPYFVFLRRINNSFVKIKCPRCKDSFFQKKNDFLDKVFIKPYGTKCVNCGLVIE
jgi:hypothetical protein